MKQPAYLQNQKALEPKVRAVIKDADVAFSRNGFEWPSLTATKFLTRHQGELKKAVSHLAASEIAEGVMMSFAADFIGSLESREESLLSGERKVSTATRMRLDSYAEFASLKQDEKLVAIVVWELEVILVSSVEAFRKGDNSPAMMLYALYVFSQMERYRTTEGKEGINPKHVFGEEVSLEGMEIFYMDLFDSLKTGLQNLSVPGELPEIKIRRSPPVSSKILENAPTVYLAGNRFRLIGAADWVFDWAAVPMNVAARLAEQTLAANRTPPKGLASLEFQAPLVLKGKGSGLDLDKPYNDSSVAGARLADRDPVVSKQRFDPLAP